MSARRASRSALAICVALSARPGRLAAFQTQQDPVDVARQTTVRVVCALPNGTGATGTGFFAGDGEHVATNWHVVACVLQGGAISIVTAARAELRARVQWAAPEKDLALLAAPGAGGTPVQFASDSAVRVGARVYGVGFPGGADRSEDAVMRLKFVSGIVSAVYRDESGRELVQTDAPLNPGNSGGPLLDECGRVVGINSEVRRGATGIAWAIQSTELFPGLEQEKLAFVVSSTRCSPAGAARRAARFGTVLQLGSLLLAAVAVFLVLASRQTRAVVSRAAALTVPSRRRAAPMALVGLDGPFASAQMALGPGQLTLGRDPVRCQVVFPQDASAVSKSHCAVRYDAAQACCTIEDSGSMNGTFLDSGERIAAGTPRRLRPGDRFYLGERRNLFEVRELPE